MRFVPTEVTDSVLAEHIKKLDETSTAMEVFRIYDEITLMRDQDPIVSYRLTDSIHRLLLKAMDRENLTQRDLSNRALWRDQDF